MVAVAGASLYAPPSEAVSIRNCRNQRNPAGQTVTDESAVTHASVTTAPDLDDQDPS